MLFNINDRTLPCWGLQACQMSLAHVMQYVFASKAPQAVSMTHVMVDVYRMDKAVVMEYQAAQERISTTYRDR